MTHRYHCRPQPFRLYRWSPLPKIAREPRNTDKPSVVPTWYAKPPRRCSIHDTVHREAEQHVKERVSDLARAHHDAEAPPLPIINLWGITGIGKSYIIRNLLTNMPRARVLWLDFATHPTPIAGTPVASGAGAAQGAPSAATTTRLALADLITWLEQTQLFGKPSRAVINWQEEPVNIDEATVTCLAARVRASIDPEHPPQLVLLDGIDDLPYWEWVQEHVIRPLIERPVQVDAPLPCVVVTSQMPLFWHFWELRERCEPLQVPPFDPDETARFLELAHDRNPQLRAYARELHAATAGYPYGLAYARAALIRVLEDRLRDLGKRYTHGIAGYLALFRRPNKRVMRVMLDNVRPPAWDTLCSQGVSPFDAIDDALHAMAEAGEIDRHNQSIKPTLRQQVEYDMQTRDRATYRAICEVLAREYQRRLRTMANKEVSFFLDWLYYTTALQLLDHPANAAAPAPSAAFVADLDQLIGIVGLLHDDVTEHFTRDRELQQRLQQAGTLTLVSERLAVAVAGTDDPPLDPTVALAMEGYEQHVTQHLEKQVPAQHRERVTTFFAVVAGFRNKVAFSAPELRGALREQGLRLRELNELVPILHNRGFFLYDSTRRTYLLNQVLLPVVKRFGWAV